MGEEEDEATPCANMDNEMRDILVLPTTHVPLHDTAQDQLSHFSQKLSCKMDEYKDFLGHNSVVVFAVNYIKNRFIPAELCAEIGKLFEILNVKTVAEFNKALESLRTDSETAVTVESFENVVKRWNEFVNDIEKKLEEKVGPVTTTVDDDELPELGVGSKTISHYVKGSAFEMVLVVVVRSFNSAEVTQHIMGLYNKMDEFHKLGCDVYLLTRGPPIGSRGGGYIKLIGVPFRKLYDEEEALSELKAHRHSAVHFIGWGSLLKTVEASLSDEMRPQSANKEQNEDQASFITQKGGTVLVDKTGKVLYKYVEDGNEKWPTVEQLIDEVKKMEPTTTTTATTTKSKAAVTTTAKIDSEVSVKEVEEKKKPCCVIL